MGGKRPDYKPSPAEDGSEGPLTSEEEESSEDDKEEVGQRAGDKTNLSDAALDVDSHASQQRGLGEWSTQIPVMDLTVDDAPDTTLFPEGHIYNERDIIKCVQAAAKKVHVQDLQWDKTMRLGQIRMLNTKIVDHYTQRIKANPPRVPVRILAKATTGVFYANAESAIHILVAQMGTLCHWGVNTYLQLYSRRTSHWVGRTTRQPLTPT